MHCPYLADGWGEEEERFSQQTDHVEGDTLIIKCSKDDCNVKFERYATPYKHEPNSMAVRTGVSDDPCKIIEVSRLDNRGEL